MRISRIYSKPTKDRSVQEDTHARTHLQWSGMQKLKTSIFGLSVPRFVYIKNL